MFSRHYILVLRAEVGNWFYICKRAVKLSWLSFQYLNTLGMVNLNTNTRYCLCLNYPIALIVALCGILIH